jgi:hypothetical protein
MAVTLPHPSHCNRVAVAWGCKRGHVCTLVRANPTFSQKQPPHLTKHPRGLPKNPRSVHINTPCTILPLQGELTWRAENIAVPGGFLAHSKGVWRGRNPSGVDPPLSLQPRLPHGLHRSLSSSHVRPATSLACVPNSSRSLPPWLG